MAWKTKQEREDQRKKEAEDIENGVIGTATLPEATPKGVNELKPQPNEFTDEYTLETIADYDPTADVFRIPNKDPNYAYRFLRFDTENMSKKTSALLYQQGGWQVAPRSHLIKIGIAERFISPDGTYHVGKNVLAFMPKALWEKKEAAKKAKADMQMSGVNRRLKEGDASVGRDIKGFGGLQTQAQLKGNFKVPKEE